MLALARDPRVVFMGQAVASAGTFMTATFAGISSDRLVELPVAEEFQLGMAIGASLRGFVPVCVYPRWNFLLLAANQLVNHLDKFPTISLWRPQVIVRVAVGPTRPIHPQAQHVGDFTEAFRSMLSTVVVETLATPETVGPAYARALGRAGSTLLVEYGDLYHEEPSGA
jgi:pyruvate/2-oxoglutarate/acetoin dehydrogenase E1 component